MLRYLSTNDVNVIFEMASIPAKAVSPPTEGRKVYARGIG